MKRKVLLFILLVSLLTANIIINSTSQYVGAIRTDEPSAKLLKRFVDLMDREDITIDYSKITSINVMPLHPRFQGLYSPQSGVILIQWSQFSWYSEETVEDIWFTILAHEILHSQGYSHSIFGGLMGADDGDMVKAIENKNVEQFILDTYKIKEYLPKISPSN